MVANDTAMSGNNWIYDKEELKKTPSITNTGLSYEAEQRYRLEGARFILDIGAKKLSLHHDTVATGIVYFHRFYMYHSFMHFPVYLTASCCLFLAGKVEETPKKSHDIIKVAREVLTEQQFSQFKGENAKEELLTLERILLQTIRFDLQVDHPYGYLMKYIQSMKADRDKLRGLLQAAWTFINDSYCTTICLQYEPEIIAIAMMFLASKINKIDLLDWDKRTTKHENWWDVYVENVDKEMLESICHQVLDVYSCSQDSSASPVSSPPNQNAQPQMLVAQAPQLTMVAPPPPPPPLPSAQMVPAPPIAPPHLVGIPMMPPPPLPGTILGANIPLPPVPMPMSMPLPRSVEK